MDLNPNEELTPTAHETLADRLLAAASLLHQAIERLAAREPGLAAAAESTLGRIVATVEAQPESQREFELEQKLAAAETRLAAVEARLALNVSATTTVTNAARKTLPTAMANLLSKQGLAGESIASMEAGALDAALVSLSMEQRIAVKAQLLRAGLLT